LTPQPGLLRETKKKKHSPSNKSDELKQKHNRHKRDIVRRDVISVSDFLRDKPRSDSGTLKLKPSVGPNLAISGLGKEEAPLPSLFALARVDREFPFTQYHMTGCKLLQRSNFERHEKYLNLHLSDSPTGDCGVTPQCVFLSETNLVSS
jgi:hypothetical protein